MGKNPTRFHEHMQYSEPEAKVLYFLANAWLVLCDLRYGARREDKMAFRELITEAAKQVRVGDIVMNDFIESLHSDS